MISTAAGTSITRFSQQVGIPLRTDTPHRRRTPAGDLPKAPWSAPVVDVTRPEVTMLSAEDPAWGHRQIWALQDLHHLNDTMLHRRVKRSMCRLSPSCSRLTMSTNDANSPRRDEQRSLIRRQHTTGRGHSTSPSCGRPPRGPRRSPMPPTTSPRTSSPGGSHPPRITTPLSSRSARAQHS